MFKFTQEHRSKRACLSLLAGLAIGLLSNSLVAAENQANAWPVTIKKSAFSFIDAVKAAQKNDPWLTGNQHTQDSLESMSVAAGSLPDPQISLGLLNLPVDSFDFAQEGMTQVRIGVAQMFPRGDTLAIKQRQLQITSAQFPFLREDRKAKVAVMAGQLWLEGFRAQQTIQLIEDNRALFEQLVDVAQASYSSASNRTRQQDIVRAQLELTRLDDRLNKLNQLQDITRFRLSEWLLNDVQHSTDFELHGALPDIPLIQLEAFQQQHNRDQQLIAQLNRHPLILAIEQKIAASQTGVELAKQQYKPEWGVNAGYAKRDADLMGNDRADFFSVGVTFDIPLFTENRQDKQVAAAISSTAAVKTEKWMALRNMIASYEAANAQLQSLEQRLGLYQDKLLPQTHEQAEASLTAYTSDDGDFAEVVRARIAELNAAIDFLDIQVEKQKTILQLNYFLVRKAEQMLAVKQVSGELQ